MSRLIKLARHNRGFAAVEFGLVAALIAVAAIGGMTSLGQKMGGNATDMRGDLR